MEPTSCVIVTSVVMGPGVRRDDALFNCRFCNSGHLAKQCFLLCRLALFLEELRGPPFQFRDLNIFDVGCEEPLVPGGILRSEEHTSELQSQSNLVCRLL